MMKPIRYIIALLLTVSICISLCLASVQSASERVITLQEQNKALKKKIEGMDEKISDIENLMVATAELLITATDYQQALIEELQDGDTVIMDELERKQDKSDRGGEKRPNYELSAAERDLVERVVMAEAGGEPYEGQVLVCQCILNACRLNDKRPAEIVKMYAYARGRPEPSESIVAAVSAVFDMGETVTDEPIIYFYAPGLVKSKFHESQRFVMEEGGHRFFAER